MRGRKEQETGNGPPDGEKCFSNQKSFCCSQAHTGKKSNTDGNRIIVSL